MSGQDYGRKYYAAAILNLKEVPIKAFIDGEQALSSLSIDLTGIPVESIKNALEWETTTFENRYGQSIESFGSWKTRLTMKDSCNSEKSFSFQQEFKIHNPVVSEENVCVLGRDFIQRDFVETYTPQLGLVLFPPFYKNFSKGFKTRIMFGDIEEKIIPPKDLSDPPKELKRTPRNEVIEKCNANLQKARDALAKHNENIRNMNRNLELQK